MSSARRGGRGRGRGILRSPNPSDDEGAARRDTRKVRFDTGASTAPNSAVRGQLGASQKQNTSKLRGGRSGTQNGGRTNGISKETNASRPKTEGTSYQQRYQTLKKLREKERADAIANGFLADPDRPRTLAEAITPVGTCPDMCPEFERLERIVQKDVWGPEVDPDSAADGHLAVLPAEDRMVKKFRRAAAGIDEQLPSDLRPPAVLQKTVDHLFHEVIGESDQLGSVHHFVWDRTRAIRNDFSIQQVSKVPDLRIAISCYERIARFHILSLHHLALPKKPYEKYDWYQEREQLDRTLLSLVQYYEDSKDRYRSPNEAEFRSYCVLFQIQNPIPDLEYRVQNWHHNLADDPQVQKALQIYAAATNIKDAQGPLKPRTAHPVGQESWEKFWRLVKSKDVSYLMACVAEIYFNLVRRTALNAIWQSYRQGGNTRPEDWTLSELATVFGFDDEDQVVTFCEHYGFSFAERTDGAAFLDLSSVQGRQLPDPSPGLKEQILSRRIVEAKRERRMMSAVIDGISVPKAHEEGFVNDMPEAEAEGEEVPKKKSKNDSLFVGQEVSDEEEEHGGVTRNGTTDGGNPVKLNPFAQPFKPSSISKNASTNAVTTFGSPSPSFGFGKPSAAMSPAASASDSAQIGTLKSSTAQPLGSKTISPSFSLPSAASTTTTHTSLFPKPGNPFPSQNSVSQPTLTENLEPTSNADTSNTPFNSSSFKISSPGFPVDNSQSHQGAPSKLSISAPSNTSAKPSLSTAQLQSSAPGSFQFTPQNQFLNPGLSQSVSPRLQKNVLTSATSPSDENTKSSGGLVAGSPVPSSANKSVLNPGLAAAAPENRTVIPKVTELGNSSVASSLPLSITPSQPQLPPSQLSDFNTKQPSGTSILTAANRSTTLPGASSSPSTLGRSISESSAQDAARNDPSVPKSSSPPTTRFGPVDKAKDSYGILDMPKLPSEKPLASVQGIPSSKASNEPTEAVQRVNLAVSHDQALKRARKKFQLLEMLAVNIVAGPEHGFIEQFVEFKAAPIIKEAFKLFAEETLLQEAARFRCEKLAARYGRLWRAVARHRRLARQGRERRARIAKRRQEKAVAEKRLAVDDDVEAFKSVLQRSQAAAKNSQGEWQKDPGMRKRSREQRESLPATIMNRSENELRTAPENNGMVSTSSRSKHKRRKTQSEIVVGAQNKAREFKLRNSLTSEHSLIEASFTNGERSRSNDIMQGSTTRTNYFRLKALGIQPDGLNSWDQPTKKRAHRGDEVAGDVSSKRSENGLEKSSKRRSVSATLKATGEALQSRKSTRQAEMSKKSESTAKAPSSGKTLAEMDAEEEELFAQARAVKEAMAEGIAFYREEIEREKLRASHSSGSAMSPPNAKSTASLDSKPKYWGRVSKFVPREDYGKGPKKKPKIDESSKVQRAVNERRVDPHTSPSQPHQVNDDYYDEPQARQDSQAYTFTQEHPIASSSFGLVVSFGPSQASSNGVRSANASWTSNSVPSTNTNGSVHGMNNANSQVSLKGGTSIEDAIEL